LPFVLCYPREEFIQVLENVFALIEDMNCFEGICILSVTVRALNITLFVIFMTSATGEMEL
jgi:hypothetical protein